MDKMEWLEPAIENGVERTFSICDARNQCVDLEINSILGQLREMNSDNQNKLLLDLENKFFSQLFATTDTAYRAGFEAAIKLMK